MVATMILSHGHLIMREIMVHWPIAETWEGRLEGALYTQGGLVFLTGLVIASAMMVRGYFAKLQDERTARREISQREKHERAAASRHEAMMESLATLSSGSSVSNGTSPRANSAKKSLASGTRPR
tara:strand:+ start:202891 stop:203265 length:375 start_codon:yes stop_codon:yes gene_type:complete